MALETNKELATVHERLGAVSLAAGDAPTAKAEFQKSLSIDPDNEKARKALEKLP
jgi:Tfp pilus assembly protein PilF